MLLLLSHLFFTTALCERRTNATLVWLIRQVRQGEACRFPKNPCLLSLHGLHSHLWWAPLLYGDNQVYAPSHPRTESLYSWWSAEVAQTLVQADLVGERVRGLLGLTWKCSQSLLDHCPNRGRNRRESSRCAQGNLFGLHNPTGAALEDLLSSALSTSRMSNRIPFSSWLPS